MTVSGALNSADPGVGDTQPLTHDDDAAPEVGSGVEGVAGGVGETAGEGDPDVATEAVEDAEVGEVDAVSATLLEVHALRASVQIAR